MSLNVTNLVGFGGGGAGGPVTLINRGAFVGDITNSTTYTFSSYGIGTASGSRRVIAYVVGAESITAGRTLSSATIGGISATIDCQVTGSGGGSSVSAIISATVPTGTTADIVLTFSGAMTEAGVVAVAVDGLSNTAPVDTLTDGSDPLSGSIDWQADGFVIGGCMNEQDPSSVTWSGITEREDTNISGSGVQVSFADSFPTTSASSQTVSATWTATVRPSMAVASYR